jgi:hypothetical protein
VSWQGTSLALASQVEGPDEGIPLKRLTTGERITLGEAAARHPPPHFGTGVLMIQGDTPATVQRACKSPGAGTNSRVGPYMVGGSSLYRRRFPLLIKSAPLEYIRGRR